MQALVLGYTTDPRNPLNPTISGWPILEDAKEIGLEAISKSL
jgi:hypothetical protein